MPDCPGSAGPCPVAGVRLDTMREKDLEQVVAIELGAFASPWQREHFCHELEKNPFAVNRVLRRDADILGYACVWIMGQELCVNDIAIHEGVRRKGLGRWLLRSLVDEALRAGCTRAILEVRPSNRPALALYEQHGFREMGRRKGYYTREGEDAIVMQATLRALPPDA